MSFATAEINVISRDASLLFFYLYISTVVTVNESFSDGWLKFQKSTKQTTPILKLTINN